MALQTTTEKLAEDARKAMDDAREAMRRGGLQYEQWMALHGFVTRTELLITRFLEEEKERRRAER